MLRVEASGDFQVLTCLIWKYFTKTGNSLTDHGVYYFLHQSHWFDGENKVEEQLNTDEQVFIDNTEIDQNPSDYYGLTNVTRSFSNWKNVVFKDYDIERCKNHKAEVRNYTAFDDDWQEDEFED